MRPSVVRLILALCLTRTAAMAGAEQSPLPSRTAAALPHTDRLLVLPKTNLPAADFDRWCDDRQVKRLPRARLGSVRLVERPDGEDLAALAARLEASGLVEFAEPDYLQFRALLPNDPETASGASWGIHNPVEPDSDIQTEAAWDAITDASPVLVAVIDSGLRSTHEDLAGNLWVNPDEVAGNGRDDDGNGIVDDVHGFDAISGSGSVVDEVGHGTHVAGVIGAVGNNGRGVAGVAWKVRLMSLKFIDADGDGATSDAIQCIDYAIAKGARIIHASWGSTARSRSLERAIDRARAAGILFVAAAGNSALNTDQTTFYPSAYAADNVISVAASTRQNTLASFSNFGAVSVDLAAPGDAVLSCWGSGDSAYAQASGTSTAAPHVSGTLALMAARCPDCTFTELRTAVLAAVDPFPALAGKVATGGRLNAAAAIARVAPVTTTVPRLELQRAITATASPRLLLSGTPLGRYRLETSADLATWDTLTSVSLDASGTAIVEWPGASAPAAFVRAAAE